MICKKCKHENYCNMAQFGGHVPPITVCSKFKEKSQTNADRIRAMTDEELAVLLEGCICPSEPCKKVVNRERQPDKKMCQSCWLDWLKQEVDDGCVDVPQHVEEGVKHEDLGD